MEPNIELRSEKIRNIVGKIPPKIDRIGIFVVSLIIFIIILGAYFIPYPEYITVPIEINKEPQMEVISSPSVGFFNITTNSKFVDKGMLIGYIKTDEDSTYNLYSPIKGKVFFNNNFNNKVRNDDILYGILLDSVQQKYGLGYVPLEIRNRLSIGLSIELNYDQISLDGIISRIDSLPTNNSLYKIEILFLDDLSGSSQETLYYLPHVEMEGNILISNKSLLKRIINID